MPPRKRISWPARPAKRRTIGRGQKLDTKRAKIGHWTIEEAQKLGKLAQKLVADEAFRKSFEENTHKVFREMGITDIPVEFVPIKFRVPTGLVKTVLSPKRSSDPHSDYSDYVDYCEHYWSHYNHNVHKDTW